jgi:hypothetical protein
MTKGVRRRNGYVLFGNTARRPRSIWANNIEMDITEIQR